MHYCLKSWLEMENHGFEICYWDQEQLWAFLNAKYKFAVDTYLTARNHAERADIARYLLVYHYGGYYVDWDISLNNPNLFLQIVQKEENGYFVVDPTNGTLASEHFSSKKHNPYLFQLVKDIVATFERGERELMGTPQYSGPFRMKATLQKIKHLEQTKISVKDIFEYSYDEIRGKREYCKSGILTHFWEHTWLK
ncbi:glycosyltransferase [Sphingobacterium sp. NGMCC 1.201703]|uniref:glycosyltransferase n=1 Tax=Sphingobacterium sp. NGMCC 1.201703 TaxID=3388657 RepID=UPI0039FD1509